MNTYIYFREEGGGGGEEREIEICLPRSNPLEELN